MKARSLSRDLLYGAYVTKKQSHTLLTITDDTYRLNTPVQAGNYCAYQPGFFEKGPTNTFMIFDGSDNATLAAKVLGSANTDLYGPMATYFFNLVDRGFSTGTINIVPKNATYANMYIALDVKHETNNDGSLKYATLYVEYDVNGDHYHMSFLKERLPNKDTVVEIEIPLLKVAYDPFVIDDLTQMIDVDTFLSDTVVKFNVDSTKPVGEDDHIHVPIIFTAYYGALPYGNNYQLDFSKTSNKIRGLYPEFSVNYVDTNLANIDHSFNFALTKVSNEYGASQSFFDKANSSTRLAINASKNNYVDLFRNYLVPNSVANKVTKAIKAMTAKYKADALSKIKEKFPAFDELLSSSDWMLIELSYLTIDELFTRAPMTNQNTFETPFAYINPFDTEGEATYKDSPIAYYAAPTSIRLEGGSRGSGVDDYISENGFDWDMEIQVDPDAVTTGKITYMNVTPATVGVGDGVRVTVKTEDVEPEKIKFFVDTLKKCYVGGIAGNAFFDPAKMPSAILFGEGYPLDLQQAIIDVIEVNEDVVFKDKCGVLWTYFRTMPWDIKDWTTALDWLRSLGDSRNHNIKTVLGMASFPDSTTGSQSRFSLAYEWIGENGKLYDYLVSCTPDGFGSGNYSNITTAIPNTYEFVPYNDENATDLREELTSLCVNYFEAKENNILGLAGDYGHIPGAESGFHTFGSTIQFNYMSGRVYVVLRNNKVDQRIDDDYLDRLKNKCAQAVQQPAQHFGGRVQFEMGVSTHPNEVGKNIPLCQMRVFANEYSQINRLEAIMSRTISE